MGPLSRRAWLQAATALGAGLVGVPGLLGCDRRRESMRVHLDLRPAPGTPSAPAQLEGLRMLVVDHLEALGGLTVLDRPAPGGPVDPLTRASFLSLEAGLGESSLAFDVDVSYVNGLKLERRSSGPMPPAEAFAWLAVSTPFRMQKAPVGRLCPEDPKSFRTLVEALAREDEPDRGPGLLDLGRELARRFPGCATAHFMLANQLYNQLLLHPLDPEAQWRAFQFYRSGLELVPHHPRGVTGYAQLLADAGLHRDAFALLEAAIGEHPFVTRLYESLCYVARTCGLLDLARRSLAKVHDLAMGWLDSPGENTYLYLGDLAAFRSTCQLRGVARDARVHFYLGYLALMDGDRAGAAGSFRASLAIPGGWYGFEDLSTLYLDSLEGRPAEALDHLRTVAQKRVALRAPDGEFTFKLAEAAAFLGDRDRAMELGELAFTQGFGCTRWFERSPLFAPARGTARYEALHQHLLERQALLESRFPPNRFKL